MIMSEGGGEGGAGGEAIPLRSSRCLQQQEALFVLDETLTFASSVKPTLHIICPFSFPSVLTSFWPFFLLNGLREFFDPPTQHRIYCARNYTGKYKVDEE